MPIKSKVTKLFYDEGKKLSGSLSKDSRDNQRIITALRHSDGFDFALQQTAVFCSKRIVNKLKNANEYVAGQRIGHIRMGGYVDIFLPENIEPQVCIGQKMIGGETIIADMKSNNPRIEGEIR